MEKLFARFAVLFGLAAFAPVAFAAGDYDSITAAVDWADAGAAVVAVAALVAGVLVLIRGSRIVLGMIRR